MDLEKEVEVWGELGSRESKRAGKTHRRQRITWNDGKATVTCTSRRLGLEHARSLQQLVPRAVNKRHASAMRRDGAQGEGCAQPAGR